MAIIMAVLIGFALVSFFVGNWFGLILVILAMLALMTLCGVFNLLAGIVRKGSASGQRR